MSHFALCLCLLPFFLSCQSTPPTQADSPTLAQGNDIEGKATNRRYKFGVKQAKESSASLDAFELNAVSKGGAAEG